MKLFKTESAAFKAGGDKVAALCHEGMPNCGFRILKTENGYKILMVPDQIKGLPIVLPFYL